MHDPVNDTVAIACTLTPDAYGDRVAWITALHRSALRAHERDGRALVLTYDAGAVADVRELVQREGECCAFLRFGVEEAGDVARLRIEVPDAVTEAGAMDALLAPFLAGTSREAAAASPAS